ncbi:MAG TPA: hypothetical protein DC034_00460 [Clostridium sp.]|jgi:hypothetical protein|uniref:Uncharacterized protein n=1 Tax=Clostridium lapidicellarium TaxID=3240931 RepID=A0ABV4DW07_9CLOT|nr:hypothetical protein [uncultured Clostridium sp.]NLU08860.1 hypothetical protein [Clostridiales bacterium]HBC95251.1 hypothetical protein [Clostridium sp.]
MIGKIIDLNAAEALISFKDGATAYTNISRLPPNIKIGDTINVNPSLPFTLNDKLKNTFFL